MNEKIKQKYKELFIELIDGDDWVGARNLIDNVVTNTQITNIVTEAPPKVEQVPVEKAATAPQATSFDNERAARFNQKEDNRNRSVE